MRKDGRSFTAFSYVIRSGKNPLEMNFFFLNNTGSISEVNDFSGDVKNGWCKFAEIYVASIV